LQIKGIRAEEETHRRRENRVKERYRDLFMAGKISTD